jgi:hypothetical protein
MMYNSVNKQRYYNYKTVYCLNISSVFKKYIFVNKNKSFSFQIYFCATINCDTVLVVPFLIYGDLKNVQFRCLNSSYWKGSFTHPILKCVYAFCHITRPLKQVEMLCISSCNGKLIGTKMHIKIKCVNEP